MIGWLLLLWIVIYGVAIWPVFRWALQEDGDVRVVGFWQSSVSAVLSLLLMHSGGYSLTIWPVWIAGAIGGVAYAVGFIILIMRCLQIGPAGPTVIINNSAMIFGVLYGILWLDPHIPNLWIIVGIIGTLVALIMVGLGKSSQEKVSHASSGLWKKLVLLGGMFSGMSFMCQTYVGLRYPGFAAGQLFTLVVFLVAALILLLSLLKNTNRLFCRRELLCGCVIGVATAFGLPATIRAFAYFGSEVVLPVTVVSPMVFIMLLGAVIYRDRVSRVTWIGCILAAISLCIISWGSAQNNAP